MDLDATIKLEDELHDAFIEAGLKEDETLGTTGNGDQAYSLGPASVILDQFRNKYRRRPRRFLIDYGTVYIR